MLDHCRRDQWSIQDLDWSRPPRPMPRAKEEAVVQYFTNMAGIERLAAALFVEEGKKTSDPTLQQIFATFVKDEVRHAQAAERLAHHFDVHHHQAYALDPHFERFFPAFVKAVRHLSPEIANVYITTGELILDVALLRSLQSYVDDPICDDAMRLINRDESRHIAVDFHMVEYYCSPQYLADLDKEPKRPLKEQLTGWVALLDMMIAARPFLSAVFFEPMKLVDPSGKRMQEAVKRIQLLSNKPGVRDRPFMKFMNTMQVLYRNPLLRLMFGRILLRVMGTQPEMVEKRYTDEDLARATRMSFDELADEALGVKYAPG